MAACSDGCFTAASSATITKLFLSQTTTCVKRRDMINFAYHIFSASTWLHPILSFSFGLFPSKSFKPLMDKAKTLTEEITLTFLNTTE